MLNSMKKEANQTFTENGAVTYESTGSECLDLFSTIGALRQADDKEIIIRFIRAYTENPDLAMKILFFARDIRNGLGERKVFRLILNWLAVYKPETVKKNMGYVAEFGRFDDLLALLDTGCESAMMEYIKKQLEADKAAMMQKMPVSLLAKWLPSVNASNKRTVKNAKRIAKAMGFSDAEYRKELAELRGYIRILENNLREKDYTFDYEKQPSKAMYKYRKAFIRNDGERYYDFLSRVEEGKANLHADNVAPYELVKPFLHRARYGSWYERDMENEFKKEEAALNATWNALPDFGGDENAITVVDTSGSMYDGMAAAVAVSLVSGVTPKIFSMVAGGIHSPYKFMLDVVESERYAKIVA